MARAFKAPLDRNQKQSALHLVSAWASSHRVLLGQVKVADKSNEITAIPDAARTTGYHGLQPERLMRWEPKPRKARTIVAKGANYVLTLKANHLTLYTQVKTWFESAHATDFKGIEFSYDQRVEAGHHRQEHRQV